MTINTPAAVNAVTFLVGWYQFLGEAEYQGSTPTVFNEPTYQFAGGDTAMALRINGFNGHMRAVIANNHAEARRPARAGGNMAHVGRGLVPS